MTPAPVTLFQPEYGDFLYATIGEGGSDTPLSLLSALARLGVDPWDEAAELSQLSLAAAKTRLASLLARLPNGSAGAAASLANVARLLQLLPQQGKPVQTLNAVKPAIVKLPVIAALLVSAVIVLSFITMRGGQSELSSGGTISTSPTGR